MLEQGFVEDLQGLEKPKKYFDGRGMYLYLQPSGAKYWRLKYRYGGLEKTLSIGVYPRVSLEEARMKTDEAKMLLRSGVDPSEFKKNQGFEIVAREWLDNNKSQWKRRYADSVLHSLERDVFPYIGSRNVSAIRPPELLAMIRRIEKRGALVVANKVLQRTRSVFRYAIQTGRASVNPATELVGVIKTKRPQHSKALPIEEMPVFIQAIKHYEGLPSTKYAVLFMILTFVRTDELRNAQWSEFDLDKALWKIPEDKAKERRAHLVPLSRQAISLLEKIKAHSNGDYLFVGRTPNKPISDKTMIQAVYRLGYKNKATIHGFRGVASTALNESGLFREDVIELQLSHVERNQVRRAYNHAKHLEERVKLMQWWADYLYELQGIKQGGFLSKVKGFFNVGLLGVGGRQKKSVSL